MVHNQLSIPKGNYFIEDVLLERAELETQFTYFASIGFSYSFGSIYNNIVNPRFSGGGGTHFLWVIDLIETTFNGEMNNDF